MSQRSIAKGRTWGMSVLGGDTSRFGGDWKSFGEVERFGVGERERDGILREDSGLLVGEKLMAGEDGRCTGDRGKT